MTFEKKDTLVWQAIDLESRRQEEHLELIASENYVSPEVLAAQGSVLTNKYAEGYPGKRYYKGCEYVDIVENLAIERVKELFSADYANVQPHSGSQANAAAYLACLQPKETILGMDLAAGGHLTHGSAVSFSGKTYQAYHYGLDPQTGLIDYNQVESLAKKHLPKVIVAGFSAYSRIVDWQIFRDIADQIGAYLIVDMAHVAGLVAVGLYPSPLQIADVTTSTTHKTLRGPRSGLILARANAELEKKLNSAVFPGLQGGPLCHIVAAKAIAFYEALQPTFKVYQLQVLKNAKIMAEVFLNRGFDLVSHGTDNHLFLVDFRKRKITGELASQALAKADITVNKNSVPNDPLPPTVTSGIRVGSPAMTTRGFKNEEAEQIANYMCDILEDPENQAKIKQIKEQISLLCKRFPVYR